MILMKWIKEIRIGAIIDIVVYSHSTGYSYPTSNLKQIDNKDIDIEAITREMNSVFSEGMYR